MVRLLINNEYTDVNAQGRQYGNALQAASYYGHEKAAFGFKDDMVFQIRQSNVAVGEGVAVQLVVAIPIAIILPFFVVNLDSDVK
jgi:hypothetical protein